MTVAALVVGLLLRHFFGTELSEFLAFVTGVVAVYLAAIEHIANWPIGIASLFIYVWVFYESKLYADLTLQIFYVVLSLQGWYEWAKGGRDRTALPISKIAATWWIGMVAAWVAGTALYIPVVEHFHGASPRIDSALTVASVITQLALNYKKLENWAIWIAIDAFYLYLYVSRHLIATAILYGIYLLMAAYAIPVWLTRYRSRQAGVAMAEARSQF